MATTTCDFKLATSLEVGCDDLSYGGLKNTAYIFNFEDIDTTNTGTPVDNVLSKLVLKSGAKAYKCYVPGSTPYTGTNKALATGTYRNKFTKQVKLVVLKNGASVSNDIIDNLANGRFVVILENDYQGAAAEKDNRYELYGFEMGCHATEMSDDKYSEETDGGWSITLEESNAPSSGIFLDSELTEDNLANLVTNGTTEA